MNDDIECLDRGSWCQSILEMMNLKSYVQCSSSIGFVHNLEEAFNITNPTVAVTWLFQFNERYPHIPWDNVLMFSGKNYTHTSFCIKSSLQQASVLIYLIIDGNVFISLLWISIELLDRCSAIQWSHYYVCNLQLSLSNEHSEKKLKILFIVDSAETLATLPIDVGDEVAFRKACFVCDFGFNKMDSCYEKILCIRLPPSLNRLKNMFYRKWKYIRIEPVSISSMPCMFHFDLYREHGFRWVDLDFSLWQRMLTNMYPLMEASMIFHGNFLVHIWNISYFHSSKMPLPLALLAELAERGILNAKNAKVLADTYSRI